jgi:hypothetical protein
MVDGVPRLKKGGRASLDAYLSRDEAAAKMGHPSFKA